MESCNGKLLVYASRFVSRGRRFEPVRNATERMARYLSLGFEIKTFKKRFESVYVYYASDGDEPIPIYQCADRMLGMDEICTSLKNMMFVLSFHPKHLALRRLRKEIMLFS